MTEQTYMSSCIAINNLVINYVHVGAAREGGGVPEGLGVAVSEALLRLGSRGQPVLRFTLHSFASLLTRKLEF